MAAVSAKPVKITPVAGLKQLTLENWREPDSSSAAFCRVDVEHGPVGMLADDWAQLILGVDVSPRAPEEIRTLFAVGRGTLIYGWFYYPLYSVGEDQLHRVAERAVAHRFTELGGPSRTKTFADRIEWLNQQGVIPHGELPRWDAIRKIRNMGSHPTLQRVGPPGDALTTLKILARGIDQVLGLAP